MYDIFEKKSIYWTEYHTARQERIRKNKIDFLDEKRFSVHFRKFWRVFNGKSGSEKMCSSGVQAVFESFIGQTYKLEPSVVLKQVDPFSPNTFFLIRNSLKMQQSSATGTGILPSAISICIKKGGFCPPVQPFWRPNIGFSRMSESLFG